MPSYDHTQRGGWFWVTILVGAAAIDAGIVIGPWPIAVCGAAIVLFGGCIAHLRVRDDGDALSVRFGPLPLMGKRIPYAGIQSVEVTRTRWYHGWGVHGWPGAWLVLNLWGYDAVALELKQPRGLFRFRRYLVGTDEPEALAAFLREKLSQTAGP